MMKKRMVTVFTVFSILAVLLASGAVAVTAAPPNADYNSHTGTVHPSGTADVATAVGAPDDGLFIQMDVGSVVIMEFQDGNLAIPDGTSAADLVIDTFDGIYPANAEISVSIDNATWILIGKFADTANIEIDLDSLGVGPVKYVMIDQGSFYIDDQYPALGFDLDAVVALNPGSATVDVYVDIKPQSSPNPLNVGSNGVVSVAILGTVDFDVTQVDPETVLLAGVAPLRWSLEDVATPYTGELVDCTSGTTEEPDGFMDLVFKFDKQALVAVIGEVEDGQCLLLTLTGSLLDTTDISGSDFVKIIKKDNNSASAQTAEPGNSGNNGKDTAPGQIKDPGEPATGKGKNK